MYYDREGNCIDAMTWGKLHANPSYKCLKQTGIKRDCSIHTIVPDTEHSYQTWVSTVWLGLDHGFENDAPILFETMVLCDEEGMKIRLNETIQRYCTEEDAMTGHDNMVRRVQGYIRQSRWYIPPKDAIDMSWRWKNAQTVSK